jgi:hypothetical protein
MNTENRNHTHGKGEGLLAGAVVAAFMALVLGICLWTALDAMRPVGPNPKGSQISASSHQAAKVLTASY